MEKAFFASDNCAPAHPAVLQALANCNSGHVASYGYDAHTEAAKTLFKKEFGADTEAYFVFNGTGANTVAVAQLTRPYHSVLCAETSHLNEDECNSAERFCGLKLVSIHTEDSKLRPELLEQHLQFTGFEHRGQPKLVSITQSSEYGTLYQPEEIKALADYAHKHNMLLHMDGARIANAAVSLNLPFKAFTKECGVDVLSFGATKNGLICGEAVVFLNPKLAEDFRYVRKQGMQLASKMRYFSSQFIPYFEQQLWKELASNANQRAQQLASGLQQLPGVKLTQPVQANAVFAILPKPLTDELLKEFEFYVWAPLTGEVRFMCSWDTPAEQVERLLERAEALSKVEAAV
jgi:threonine aldolase